MNKLAAPLGNQPSNHTQMGPQGHPWWQNRESRPPLCVAPYGKLERHSNAGLARSTGFRTQRTNPCLPPLHLGSSSSWSPHGRCWDVCPAEHGPCAMLAREVGSGSQHACADTELRTFSPRTRPEHMAAQPVLGAKAIITCIMVVTSDPAKRS